MNQPFLNFYPGPSRLYPSIENYSIEAFKSGILEKNHRSNAFMSMMENTIEIFKSKQNIPADYHVFFTSSATECWEITAQSVLTHKSQFLYNGAFGKKWFKYAVTNPQMQAEANKAEFRGSRFFVDEKADTVELDANNSAVCLVACETSNGTQISNVSIKNIKKQCEKALLLVDATSVLGGQFLDFTRADIWFASSQKCLGLPSGLGIMIVSPEAMYRAEQVNERNHYNSLVLMAENFKKYQTHYTPNILGIYLLGRLMHDVDNINSLNEKIKDRAQFLYDEMAKMEKFEALVSNKETRSNTVLAFKTTLLDTLKCKAKSNGILIGNGYGEWRNDTFRIANFPAIPDQDFEQLLTFLRSI
jgi:phosphoserine aminotransferase